MGTEATHVLRSVAGRTLSDLGQTLYEANRRRCIKGVRERGGLCLELCPIPGADPSTNLVAAESAPHYAFTRP